MPAFVDRTGESFGRLIVISKEQTRSRRTHWLCECVCGRRLIVCGDNLKSGNTQSCGCLQIEHAKKAVSRLKDTNVTHGHSRRHRISKTYRAWHQMLQRCNRPKSPNFPNYGGRGIAVCARWGVFENFLADMGECPSQHSIDRIDNNGNYEPGNCRWATIKQQLRNTRRNRLITLRGETHCVADWSDIRGLPRYIIANRLDKGWSEHDAIMTPLSH